MAALQRAERIVTIHEHRVEDLQKDLATANNHLSAMETELTDAEKAHQEALDSPRPIATVEDLEVASGHLHVLQRAIDMAKRRVADAASAVEKQRQLLIEAQTELRKFELWRDRGLQQQEEEASRVERKLTDDLAARTLRR